MPEPYIGEVKIVSWNFAPTGWAFCNGAVLSINQNQALFAILGNRYGGDGRTTFALPNLQGRVPVHVNANNPAFASPGVSGGEAAHTLTMGEMPSHTHTPVGNKTPANSGDPTGALWANDSGGLNEYAPTPNTTMNSACVGTAGSSQPHNNMSPYLVLNYIIALVGIFPSRN